MIRGILSLIGIIAMLAILSFIAKYSYDVYVSGVNPFQ